MLWRGRSLCGGNGEIELRYIGYTHETIRKKVDTEVPHVNQCRQLKSSEFN